MVQKKSWTERYRYSKGTWSRDLAQVVLQDSDTSGPKGSSYRDPRTDLAQVVQDPDAESKWSKRILTQRSHRVGPTGAWKESRSLIQRSCTSATTGSWDKWSKRIRIQGSCYTCRADLPSLLVGVHSHTLFGVSCRDNVFLCVFWC